MWHEQDSLWKKYNFPGKNTSNSYSKRVNNFFLCNKAYSWSKTIINHKMYLSIRALINCLYRWCRSSQKITEYPKFMKIEKITEYSVIFSKRRFSLIGPVKWQISILDDTSPTTVKPCCTLEYLNKLRKIEKSLNIQCFFATTKFHMYGPV